MARDDGSDEGALEPAQDHHRAGDADRQKVADRLRQALDDGRLTLLEYDERLRAAYGSLTYGELAKVTSDLPATAPAAPPEQAPPKAPSPARSYLIRQGRGWLGGAVITNGIWAATSGFDWHHYWPGVVLPIWAAAIAAKLVSGGFREDGEKSRHRDRLRHRDDRRSLPE
ncbi:DUF1707 SHOCT-like domain-containing protein [Pseudonocardia acaciae]|uniref:DUF1707 SHOCT-like domain-containing protein n=1 Tax=Pseudonocardia acaciae TaxID=551276 RepID=UPI0006856B8D|nr:DUF1707 domain-containing protein [Pseudonocardia acaciae]